MLDDVGKREAKRLVISTPVESQWRSVPDTPHVTGGDISLDCPCDEGGDDDGHIAYQRIKVRYTDTCKVFLLMLHVILCL